MKLLVFKDATLERLTLHHQQLSHLLRLKDDAFTNWCTQNERHLVAFLSCYAHTARVFEDELVGLLMDQLNDKVLRLVLRSVNIVWAKLFLITRVALLVRWLHQPHLLKPFLWHHDTLLRSSDERVNAIAIMVEPLKYVDRIRGMKDEVAQAACIYAAGSDALCQFAISAKVRASLERYFSLDQTNDPFYRLLDDKTFVKANLETILNYEDDDSSGEDDEETLDPKLLDAFIKDHALFERSARSTPQRSTLLNTLKLTHEQLEGWAIMFKRNPRMQQIIYRHQLN